MSDALKAKKMAAEWKLPEGWAVKLGKDGRLIKVRKATEKLETSLNDSRFVCAQFPSDGVMVYDSCILDHCLQVNGPGKTEIYHTKAMGLKASMLQVWLWSLGPV